MNAEKQAFSRRENEMKVPAKNIYSRSSVYAVLYSGTLFKNFKIYLIFSTFITISMTLEI